MKNALISIGEALHASIPKTGAVMQELHDLGPDAYSTDSGPLATMRAVIEDQAVEGADYIAVNVDAFGEQDPQLAVAMMVRYVKLVRQWGRGVPVCIDSSDDDVLRAGLTAWYDTEQAVPPPLVNSIKTYTADAMMPLKAQYDFAFVGLLMSEDKPTGPGGSHSVEELVALARQIYDKAVQQYGFKPREIFLDSTVFPLAIDMPMVPDVPGYTYRTFETIKRIKSDPALQGVHFSLGISNCCRNLPGRKIGICRAYVAKAMEYGLDAGIVNVNHHYGSKPADPDLLTLVEAFAVMDGSAERTNQAIARMSRFCADCRKKSGTA
jgi:cobalamin-dependent methionine synthase I